MEFTQRYSNSLNIVFIYSGDLYQEDRLITDITFDEHNVFRKMLVVDVSSDEIEVPVIAKAAIEGTVAGKLMDVNNVQKVVVSLYVNSYTQTRRTADSIVNEFFSRTNFNSRLQKVITNKGEVYYGGKGIILDKDFKPLILCSLICKKTIDSSDTYMDYYKPVIRISPEVFLNESGLIHKSILKKIIPYYLTHSMKKVNNYSSTFRDRIPKNTVPHILVEDSSRFIESPVLPNPNTCSNESLNELLIDNIQDVLNEME